VVNISKKICIIGLGYIGLPTAAMFASHGFDILGVDTNRNVVDALNNGQIIIEEPYLDVIVQAAVTSGNLRASLMPEKSDIFIIAVPTPIKTDKTADMSHVSDAANSIVPFLEKGNTVILESTSPPGTTTDLLLPLLEKSGLKAGIDFLLAHSPERVLPGRILLELVQNNRIIGGINDNSSESVKELYSTFVKGQIILTDAKTAEMCKLMENTFRDVNIALSNELAIICEHSGINAWEVIEHANRHPRVNLHNPGPGVGGHCIAVDPWFIVEKTPSLANIISLARKINDSMPYHVMKRIEDITHNISGKKKICILGITYKANVDDTRESPILKLIDILKENDGYEVTAYDPHVFGIKQYDLFRGGSIYDSLKGCHIAVIAVNHDEFSSIDFKMVKEVMSFPNILDTRNCQYADLIRENGLNYYLLGSGR
jgi:UDP-N-acetyl-D-mannosaminuronic acid dehydrogenase